jgi:hypothetical protein
MTTKQVLINIMLAVAVAELINNRPEVVVVMVAVVQVVQAAVQQLLPDLQIQVVGVEVMDKVKEMLPAVVQV